MNAVMVLWVSSKVFCFSIPNFFLRDPGLSLIQKSPCLAQSVKIKKMLSNCTVKNKLKAGVVHTTILLRPWRIIMNIIRREILAINMYVIILSGYYSVQHVVLEFISTNCKYVVCCFLRHRC